MKHWAIDSPTDDGLFAVVRGGVGMHTTLVSDGYGTREAADLDAKTLNREHTLSRIKTSPVDPGFPRGGYAPPGWEPIRRAGYLSLNKVRRPG